MATAGDNLSNICCFSCFYMLFRPFFCLLSEETELRCKDDRTDGNLSNLGQKRALIKNLTRNTIASGCPLNEITLATQPRMRSVARVIMISDYLCNSRFNIIFVAGVMSVRLQ